MTNKPPPTQSRPQAPPPPPAYWLTVRNIFKNVREVRIESPIRKFLQEPEILGPSRSIRQKVEEALYKGVVSLNDITLFIIVDLINIKDFSNIKPESTLERVYLK